jgi:mRNA-degrading endonuclease RelE of RelBE toxin-antitoxin system
MVHLDELQFSSALKVLEREQRAILPSRLQTAGYHLFNVSVIVFILFLAVVVLDDNGLAPRVVGAALHRVFHSVYMPLAGAMIGLFVVNIPMMRTLWRQEVLRRRVGLQRQLRFFFRRGNYGTGQLMALVLTVVGLIFVIWLTIMVAILEGDSRFLFTIPFAGLSLLSMAIMRRGRERLAIVQELQGSLADHRSDTDQGNDATDIDPEAFRMIAGLERAQIIEERRESLKVSRQRSPAPGYTVQQSRAVIETKAQLDDETSRRVQDQIFELMDNPVQEASRTEASTGVRRLRVRETPLEVGYVVEEQSQRVKVLFLNPVENPGQGGGTDG